MDESLEKRFSNLEDAMSFVLEQIERNRASIDALQLVASAAEKANPAFSEALDEELKIWKATMDPSSYSESYFDRVDSIIRFVTRDR